MSGGQRVTVGGELKAAKVYRTATYNIPNADSTTGLPWDTEEYDYGNFWSVGAGSRFTIPVGEAGLYTVGYTISTDSSTADAVRWLTFLLKNGGTVRGGRFDWGISGAASTPASSGQLDLELGVGDYVEIVPYQQSGVTKNLYLPHSSFWITKRATSAVQINPSGRGTRAYRTTSTQSLTSGTHTAIALNAEEYDDDGLHDIVTNNSRFVIAVTGRYRIEGQISYVNHATGGRFAVIWKNSIGTGSRLAQFTIPSPGSLFNTRMQVFTGIIPLVAGDYIELGGWQDSGAPLEVTIGAGETWMSLERIS